MADGSSVAELLSSGAPAPGSPFAGAYDATAVADGFYPPSNGPSITAFTNTGTLYGPAAILQNFAGTSAAGAQIIAAAPAGGISPTGSLYLLNSTGVESSYSFGEYAIEAGQSPYSLATGASSTVWVTNSTGGGLDGPRGSWPRAHLNLRVAHSWRGFIVT